MNLFQEKVITPLMSSANFADLIKTIENIPKFHLNKILELPWDDYGKEIRDIIIESLNNFKNTENKTTKAAIPPEGLKGIYFCLGDDGVTLDVGGSLYFDENDWAANTEFYPKCTNKAPMLFINMSNKLKLLQLNINTILEVMFLFSVFAINQTIKEIENISEIANAGIAVGYSDGDELILGNFVNGKFIQSIQIIKNGRYERPASAPQLIRAPVEPRGMLWNYLQLNYRRFISEHGLAERFDKYGEQEAKKTSEEFKQYIFINRCEKCGFIKKTPMASLCLNCGNFSKAKTYGK